MPMDDLTIGWWVLGVWAGGSVVLLTLLHLYFYSDNGGHTYKSRTSAEVLATTDLDAKLAVWPVLLVVGTVVLTIGGLVTGLAYICARVMRRARRMLNIPEKPRHPYGD